MTLSLFERTPDPLCSWTETHKGHPRLIELADRHYTRQKPGSNQACRPGVNLVLLASDGTAAWVTWRPIPEVGRQDNLEAWECTIFRNEGPRLSSDLVREATALTFRRWGWPPRDGLITAVGIAQTKRRRSKNSPVGKCYLEAGWEPFDHPSGAADKAWFQAPRPKRTERDASPAQASSCDGAPMTNPRPVATILIEGTVFACSPCQSSAAGPRHAGPHLRTAIAPPTNRAGVVRVEWYTAVPKPKRAKRKKGGRRG